MADYRKLSQSERDDSSTIILEKHSRRTFNLPIIASLLLNLSLLTYVAITFAPSSSVSPPSGRYAKTPPLRTTWSRFYWHTRWDSPNRTATDELWSRINPAHGFVAVDRERAREDGWPESMYLPSDHSKGVYLLEAYHQLHCLKIVRQTFLEAVEGREYTYDPHHAGHCFDALLQSAVCNADSTPLYTFGDKTAGDGQVHKCRSWEELRDWATENTACYRDSIEEINLGDHFGHCDDGGDGISTDGFRLE